MKVLDRFTFPFANTIDFYGELFNDLASVSETVGLVLITSTMHPSSWLAARKHNMSVVVWGPRTSMHSRKHGIALAKSVTLTRYFTEDKNGPNPPITASTLELIEGPQLGADSQVLEPYDVSRGDAWVDGLNPFFQPEELSKLAHSLLHSEFDKRHLTLTEPRENFGRGLMNMRYVGEGERVLDASCLWYDSKDKLLKSVVVRRSRFRTRAES